MTLVVWRGVLIVGLLALVGTFYVATATHQTRTSAPRATITPSVTSLATTTMDSLTLTSAAFANDGMIPAEFTCDGKAELPPLSWTGAPTGTVAFVLVMDDPDIPDAVKQTYHIQKYDHIGIYDIPGDATALDASSNYSFAENSAGERGYTPPCPPTQYQPTEHRYIFRLYALSAPLDFATPPTLDELEAAAKEKALTSATLIGRYDRTTH